LQIRGYQMKKIILTVSLFFSSTAMAHDLPNTFEAGEPIVASEINANFESISSKLDVINSSLDKKNSKVVEIVGLTDPTIWGSVNFTNGINMCPNKYPGSRICSGYDLREAATIPTLDPSVPIIFIEEYPRSNIDQNSCNDFKSTRENAKYHLIIDNNGNLNMTRGLEATEDNIEPNVLAWIKNLTQVNSGTALEQSENSYWPYSSNNISQIRVYTCAISIPALCCK